MHAPVSHTPRELALSLGRVNESITEFNRLYANGRENGLLLGELIPRGTPEEIKALVTSPPGAHEKNYLTAASELTKMHAGILRRTGLEVRVDEGIHLAAEIICDFEILDHPFGQDLEKIQIHVAELAINDFDEFLGFLDGLERIKSSFTPSTETVAAFSRIAEALTATLERLDFRKKLEYLDQTAEPLVRQSYDVVEMLYETKFTSVAEKLSGLVALAGREELSDHLRAKRYHLLPNDPEGPQSWHLKYTGENFKNRWQRALLVSRDLVAEGRTTLSKTISTHLYASAREAYQAISDELNTAQPTPHLKQHGPLMLEELALVLDSLSVRSISAQRNKSST